MTAQQSNLKATNNKATNNNGGFYDRLTYGIGYTNRPRAVETESMDEARWYLTYGSFFGAKENFDTVYDDVLVCGKAIELMPETFERVEANKFYVDEYLIGEHCPDVFLTEEAKEMKEIEVTDFDKYLRTQYRGRLVSIDSRKRGRKVEYLTADPEKCKARSQQKRDQVERLTKALGWVNIIDHDDQGELFMEINCFYGKKSKLKNTTDRIRVTHPDHIARVLELKPYVDDGDSVLAGYSLTSAKPCYALNRKAKGLTAIPVKRFKDYLDIYSEADLSDLYWSNVNKERFEFQNSCVA